MGFTRALPLALGALAVSSGVAMLTFDIIFAATLSQNSSPVKTNVVAIVASGLSAVTVGLLLLLLGRQVRYRNGAHIQDFGHGRQHTYLLAGFGAVFGILSAVSSAILLGLMRTRQDLPKRIITSSTKALVIASFIVWAISLLSQAVFIICMVIIQRRDFQQQIQTYDPEREPQNVSEMIESARPGASSVQRSMGHRTTPSLESPPPSSGRSRAGSDTMSSFRSSFSQVVRPISSKTKLISHNHRSPYRPQSIESNHRETIVSIEDGFDSWDTSAVDSQSREAVASASPTPPRFLETIPASPTTSRSASPGFPLDLEPPKRRKRSRSYSPANSSRDLSKTARTQSPTESVSSEAHIHPLFRTDSPTPPPAATPGTIVTAAPGAGQVISDRQSIRSIHRMRSGSLPSSPSPLVHSTSLDSIRLAIEREELEILEEVGGERTLTPPIPDFILNGGPRSSMQLYNSRKKPAGLGMLGEVRDA
ncbi:hypothetical protein ONS95_009579 [Cadophora gregata]|uniref:uncharacterized protein n=1 Tax=Cadophora gregata TaxID=51156 RepID=UPI0026DA8567|nr:uncharacterized protein ONS95_009579 [Cadophora gregata]KAK0124632.1 hypothetical protein ONS95_009579 [Cadophora gregata]KAK0129511.1 hypothetical protein ONS96_000077 [Cadophora gregata f. sp. sojae]